MAKIIVKRIKISKRRNVKRSSGKAGLRIIKRGVKILTKKYNRKNINAHNTTINSINSSNTTKPRTIADILNEDSFLEAIPDDLDPDYEIHTDGNYYN